MGKNIDSGTRPAPTWDPQNVTQSLRQNYDYVELQAKDAINWYYKKKAPKARWSRCFRLATIVLTSIGALVPIIATLVLSDTADQPRFNMIGYVSVALAAFFLAMDRFSGSSTGWMRYIATAMALETLLEEFRLDWVRLNAGIKGTQPDDAQTVTFLERLRSFTLAVRSQVEKETQAWIAEFQSNLAQMEKATKEALDTAREKADAAREEARKQIEAIEAGKREAAQSQRPGAIDLTINPAVPLDQGFTVEIDGKTHRECVTSNTCGIVGVIPGLHEVAIKAVSNGNPIQASKVVIVRGCEVAPLTINLK